MKHLKIALVCAFTALAIPAQAATVGLNLTTDNPDFADGRVNNGDTSSAGDFALTFENIQDGGARPRVTTLGMFLGSTPGSVNSVDLVFTIDTIIETYMIGVSSFLNTTFQLAGGNGTSGLNSMQTSGTFAFDMGSIPVFLAGETYTLTHTIFEDIADLRALHVSSPPPAAVPLPASLPLLLAGLGATAFLRRRS